MKAVILNDTRSERHFGCARVMRVIIAGLEARGIQVSATSGVRHAWDRDRAFLAAVADCDLVVINGEGTLHHGSRHGEELLKIAEHPAASGKPKVLINALYQENPPLWGRYLSKFDGIWMRDSWSAAHAGDQMNRQVQWLPDLSLADGGGPQWSGRQRDLLTLSESVVGEISRDLIGLFQERRDVRFLPITATLKSSKPTYGRAGRTLREAYIHLHAGAFRLRNPGAIFSRNEDEFAAWIARSFLHISGRFHAICFCLAEGTPFLALSSNSWKMEALLEDIGLGASRIVPAAELRQRLADPAALAFSAEEQSTIEQALAKARRDAAGMFDGIAEIARGHRS